ncbi:MAG: dUTP diphosphatase [Pseudomonadota bacterium]
MTAVEVQIRHLPAADPGLPLPAYATAGAAGLDVVANLPDPLREVGLTLAPGARDLVPTGLAMAIPEGFEIQVRPRSGLARKHGITVANAPGTIDADYRGEVGVLLVNLGDTPFRIAHGDRIAQLVLAPVVRAAWRPVETLDETARGSGGFGSTGVSG